MKSRGNNRGRRNRDNSNRRKPKLPPRLGEVLVLSRPPRTTRFCFCVRTPPPPKRLRSQLTYGRPSTESRCSAVSGTTVLKGSLYLYRNMLKFVCVERGKEVDVRHSSHVSTMTTG
jgi:hypothetical protein